MSLLGKYKTSLESHNLTQDVEVTALEAFVAMISIEEAAEQVVEVVEDIEHTSAVADELQQQEEVVETMIEERGGLTEEAAVGIALARRAAAVALGEDPDTVENEEVIDEAGLESLVISMEADEETKAENTEKAADQKKTGLLAKTLETVRAAFKFLWDKIKDFGKKIAEAAGKLWGGVKNGATKAKEFFQKVAGVHPDQKAWQKALDESKEDENARYTVAGNGKLIDPVELQASFTNAIGKVATMSKAFIAETKNSIKEHDSFIDKLNKEVSFKIASGDTEKFSLIISDLDKLFLAPTKLSFSMKDAEQVIDNVLINEAKLKTFDKKLQDFTKMFSESIDAATKAMDEAEKQVARIKAEMNINELKETDATIEKIRKAQIDFAKTSKVITKFGMQLLNMPSKQVSFLNNVIAKYKAETKQEEVTA